MIYNYVIFAQEIYELFTFTWGLVDAVHRQRHFLFSRFQQELSAFASQPDRGQKLSSGLLSSNLKAALTNEAGSNKGYDIAYTGACASVSHRYKDMPVDVVTGELGLAVHSGHTIGAERGKKRKIGAKMTSRPPIDDTLLTPMDMPLGDLASSDYPIMPFTCEQCGKGFMSAPGLYKHMNKHKGIQFPCPVCDAKFEQLYNTRRHLKSQHQCAQCRKCQQIFKLGEEYNEHMRLYECSPLAPL